MLLQKLEKKGLISCPSWLSSNTCYLSIMGSTAYGVSSDTSDCDIYGIAIPRKEMVFPHLAGEIPDFGRQKKRFLDWQQHHVKDDQERKEYDFTVFGIVRFFSLLMENNPNVVDSIFTPFNCILHSTHVGNMIRENRKIFIHKGLWHKFKGYSFSQQHKMKSKFPKEGSNRQKDIAAHGFDCKFAYHLVRLLYEAEMLMQEGDMDMQRHKEHLKAIRRGEVSEEDILQWSADKEKYLENLYNTCSLPYGPDEEKIKNLLLSCLESHYGSLENCIVKPDAAITVLRQVQELLDKNRNLF